MDPKLGLYERAAMGCIGFSVGMLLGSQLAGTDWGGLLVFGAVFAGLLGAFYFMSRYQARLDQLGEE